MQAQRPPQTQTTEVEHGHLDAPPSAFPMDQYTQLRNQTDRDDEVHLADSLPPRYDDHTQQTRPSVDLPSYQETASFGHDTLDQQGGQDKGQEDTRQQPDLSVSHTNTQTHLDEKRNLDLQAVSDAIDRAYTANPPLNDQRSELRPVAPKSHTPHQATSFTTSAAAEKRLSKEQENELNKIFDQIERAHGNKMSEQRSELDEPSVSTQKRESFYSQLQVSSSAGRMHNQDHDQDQSS